MRLADVGLAAIGAEIEIGWLEPRTLLDRMRQIDATARALDAQVAANVTDPTYRANWTALYTRWRSFADPYELETHDPSYNASILRAQMVYKSDAMAQEIEGWRLQIEDMRAKYGQLRDAQGRPLPDTTPGAPKPSPIPPPSPEPPDGQKTGLSLSAWALIGLGIAALGGLLTWRFIETRRRLHESEKSAQALLPAVLGLTTEPAKTDA